MKKFSKILFLFTLVLMLAIPVCAATTRKTIEMKGKTSTVKVTMNIGDKLNLKVKDGKKVVTNAAKYKSSKKTVTTVSKAGVVVGKKKGASVVTIKYKKKTVKLKVTVKNPDTNRNTNTFSSASTKTNTITKTGNDTTPKGGADTNEHGEIEIRNVDVGYDGLKYLSYKAIEMPTKPHYYRVTFYFDCTNFCRNFVRYFMKDTVLEDYFYATYEVTQNSIKDGVLTVPIASPVPAGEYDIKINPEWHNDDGE